MIPDFAPYISKTSFSLFMDGFRGGAGKRERERERERAEKLVQQPSRICVQNLTK
jgi:hypothetical protein